MPDLYSFPGLSLLDARIANYDPFATMPLGVISTFACDSANAFLVEFPESGKIEFSHGFHPRHGYIRFHALGQCARTNWRLPPPTLRTCVAPADLSGRVDEPYAQRCFR